jgi:putative ABC transport system permease protein
MRLIDIITTASANMWRSKLRTLLTIVAIFIGALTLTLTNGIGAGISQYIDRQLGNVGAEDALVIMPVTDAGTGISGATEPKKYDSARKTTTGSFGDTVTVFGPADLAKIKAESGIKSVEPYLTVAPDYIMGRNGQKYQIQASPDVDGTRLDLAAGRLVSNKKSAEHQIVLPLGYVKSLGFHKPADAIDQPVKIGITNALGQHTEINAVIAGVQQQGLLAAGGATLNASLAEALHSHQTQGLSAAVRDQFNFAVARFDTSLTEEQQTQLKEKLKKKGYEAQTVADRIGLVKSVISGIVAVLSFFAAIALLAASFGIINTLLMAVQERTKEIGLMKAMGMGRGRIFLLFSFEAVMIGFWGSLVGVAVAIGIGQIANHIVSTTILKDLPGFQLLVFPPMTVLWTMLLIMGIAFVAGTLPARRAAKQNPIDALRYE